MLCLTCVSGEENTRQDDDIPVHLVRLMLSAHRVPYDDVPVPAPENIQTINLRQNEYIKQGIQTRAEHTNTPSAMTLCVALRGAAPTSLTLENWK